MDSSEMILTEPVSQPTLLKSMEGIIGASDEKKKDAAKDFESILLSKIFDQIQKTMGNWGFEESGTSKQINGIYWMYLAQAMGNEGGLGIWKDIYTSIQNLEQQGERGSAAVTLDGKV